jgi:hypothetical protein
MANLKRVITYDKFVFVLIEGDPRIIAGKREVPDEKVCKDHVQGCPSSYKLEQSTA